MDVPENKMTVRAVERALDILLCFLDRKDLTLTEISKVVSLNKSTVYRLLSSLEGKGFLIRNQETEKYRLGFRIWELSANLNRDHDPSVLLLPELVRLRDLVGETVSLYVRDGMERVRIQAVESTESIRRVAPVGIRLPLSVGASSKILVAYGETTVVDQVLNDSGWPEGIAKPFYRQQIAEIKEKGFATSIEERETGTAAVSVPIFSRDKQLLMALSVSGPSNRLTIEKMKENLPIIKEAAQRMETMLP